MNGRMLAAVAGLLLVIVSLLKGEDAAMPVPASTAAAQAASVEKTTNPKPTAVNDEYAFYIPAAYFQAPPAPPGCQPQPHIPAVSLSSEAQLVQILNTLRQNNGLPALAWANGPTQASRRHAVDMAENAVEDFTGSDGSNPGERLRDACYDWVVVGQIIGWGYADPLVMAPFWTGSRAHTALLLDPRYDDIGTAYAYKEDSRWGHYWAVTLAQPAGPNIRATAVRSSVTCAETLSGPGGGSQAIWTQEEPCPQ